VKDLRPPPVRGGDEWKFDPDLSFSLSQCGVHVHTWRRGDQDAIVAFRGTTLDEVAHFVGNLGLILAKGEHHFAEGTLEWARSWGLIDGEAFIGAREARCLLRQIIRTCSPSSTKIWVTGHSRGAALAQHAALCCSEELAAVIGFESPGVPSDLVRAEFPSKPERYVDYYTYPNYITLLHPAVNKQQRFHIPAICGHEATTWSYVSLCAMSDANRLLNWIGLGLPPARAVGWMARAASGAVKGAKTAATLHAAGHGLKAMTTIMKSLQGHRLAKCAWTYGKLSSAQLSWEDIKMAHGIAGIVERLYHEGGERSLMYIRTFPSDHVASNDENGEQSSGFLSAALRQRIVEFARNELLFGQSDQPGLHQLLSPGGQKTMWQVRLDKLWSPHWELEELAPVQEVPASPAASANRLPNSFEADSADVVSCD